MWTGVYFPNDGWITFPNVVIWSCKDDTTLLNNNSYVEGPSYCVRLLVFDYDYDDA